MYRNATRFLLVLLAVIGLLAGVAAGEGDGRKVKTRVEPLYPELAKQYHVAGTVRIEIVIAHDGTVKATRAVGGHPLLVESAEKAVKRWRYEPGPETTTIIEFHFRQN